MLKNSEFNATEQIRNFLLTEGIFDYNALEDGTKKYIEGVILAKSESKKKLGLDLVFRL
ncbi:hypothetical protein ACEZ3G_10445 [Maribacter algicola]|uniref:Uncharacterized protein n=1 Tax=Meishania litoralis TaxID=3434685 RepID=A0ACC7LKX3_9FLAO